MIKIAKVDIENLMNELIEWRKDLDDVPTDDIKIAMIDTFEDMIIENILDEEEYN